MKIAEIPIKEIREFLLSPDNHMKYDKYFLTKLFVADNAYQLQITENDTKISDRCLRGGHFGCTFDGSGFIDLNTNSIYDAQNLFSALKIDYDESLSDRITSTLAMECENAVQLKLKDMIDKDPSLLEEAKSSLGPKISFLSVDAVREAYFNKRSSSDLRDNAVMRAVVIAPESLQDYKYDYILYPEQTFEEIVNKDLEKLASYYLKDIARDCIIADSLDSIDSETKAKYSQLCSLWDVLQISTAKNVDVTVDKDGRSCTFKYPKNMLSSSVYCDRSLSDYYINATDRERVIKTFDYIVSKSGNYILKENIYPADISEVKYRGKVIWQAPSESEISHEINHEEQNSSLLSALDEANAASAAQDVKDSVCITQER